MNIQIKILFFGKSRDLLGKKHALLNLPEEISYDELLKVIVKEYSLDLIAKNIILAVNEEYCEQGQKFSLKSTDEIAVIPPLSGG